MQPQPSCCWQWCVYRLDVDSWNVCVSASILTAQSTSSTTSTALSSTPPLEQLCSPRHLASMDKLVSTRKHPCVLVVAAVPYVSTRQSKTGTFLCKIPVLNSANEIAHEKCDRALVMWYNIGWFQPHAAHVKCNVWDVDLPWVVCLDALIYSVTKQQNTWP